MSQKDSQMCIAHSTNVQCTFHGTKIKSFLTIFDSKPISYRESISSNQKYMIIYIHGVTETQHSPKTIVNINLVHPRSFSNIRSINFTV